MIGSSLAILCAASVTKVSDATKHFIQFADQPNWSSERNWWLGAQAPYDTDRRNKYSAYVDIQAGNLGWERAVWDVLPADEFGNVYIQFVDQQNWAQQRGWWLGAQNAYKTDHRNNNSTYVDIQEGNEGWERATWRLIPAGEPDHFYIQFVHQMNWDRQKGWWLGAQDAYETDHRNDNSVYVDVQEGNEDWVRASWKLIPVHGAEELPKSEQTTGTALVAPASVAKVNDATQYFIQFADQPNWSSERNWWLGAQAPYDTDRRNKYSAYVDIQAGNLGWERAVWDVLPADELGTVYIQFVEQQNWAEQRGWWLGAQNAYKTDHRNNNSTYVDIQEGNEGWERATWRLIPTGEPDHFYIQFVHQMNWDRQKGWWLGAQDAYETDHRNANSVYVDVQEGNEDWVRASWKLIPVHGAEELPKSEQATGTALVAPALV